jgi:uncharacterized protein
MRWRRLLWAIPAAAAVILFAVLVQAAEPQFPALTGRVVDDARILSAAARDKLTQMLEGHEQATGEQVVVVTVPSLQGYPIEDFGYRLGRHWGIGEKGRNTGALLIVAPKERAVRIEVGYGLEDRLTDAFSRAIIERDITPAFRQGDYDGGVLAGVASILRALGGSGDAVAGRQRTAEPQPDDILVVVFIVVVVLIVLSNGFRRRGGIVMGPLLGGTWSAGSRSRDDGFGGFSGGGGSFGGGGASGRW